MYIIIIKNSDDVQNFVADYQKNYDVTIFSSIREAKIHASALVIYEDYRLASRFLDVIQNHTTGCSVIAFDLQNWEEK